jgi:rhodanese-related sulfurtransferase
MSAAISGAAAGARSDSPAHAAAGDARQPIEASVLPDGGSLAPAEAWTLFQAGEAVLVDVRSAEERKFVGYVEGSVHVAWATGTSLTRNPRFARELEGRVGKRGVVLLLCRSGNRAAQAAEAAAQAGFPKVYFVREGFEGELDAAGHRGAVNGWRYRGLPWKQD